VLKQPSEVVVLGHLLSLLYPFLCQQNTISNLTLITTNSTAKLSFAHFNSDSDRFHQKIICNMILSQTNNINNERYSNTSIHERNGEESKQKHRYFPLLSEIGNFSIPYSSNLFFNLIPSAWHNRKSIGRNRKKKQVRFDYLERKMFRISPIFHGAWLPLFTLKLATTYAEEAEKEERESFRTLGQVNDKLLLNSTFLEREHHIFFTSFTFKSI